MPPVKRLSNAEKLHMRDDIRDYVLDSLHNSETRAKQLEELLRKPDDKFLATPRVVDRIATLMEEGERHVRILAIDAYIAILNKNPEMANKERVDRFLKLAEDDNPGIREAFLRRVTTPIEGLKELNYEVRRKVFEWLDDPDPGVRREAREVIQYKFGISAEVLNAMSHDMTKFNKIQRREAWRLMENFTQELGKGELDVNAVFEEMRKLTKETGQYEFRDFKIMVQIARNLLHGVGDVEGYNECLELSYGLYRGINKRIEETRSSMTVGSSKWVATVEKIFKDWIPDLAADMSYSHLSMGLREAIEEVKRRDPEEIRDAVLEVLKHGKA